MHMPRFIWVAWIMDLVRSVPRGFPSHRTSYYSSLDLEAPQVQPERHRPEAGGSHRRFDPVAAAGRRPHRHHAAPARAADLGRPARGLGGGGDAVDLGA